MVLENITHHTKRSRSYCPLYRTGESVLGEEHLALAAAATHSRDREIINAYGRTGSKLGAYPSVKPLKPLYEMYAAMANYYLSAFYKLLVVIA